MLFLQGPIRWHVCRECTFIIWQLRWRKVGMSVGPRVFSLTLSLGQMWSPAPVFLPDAAAASLWAPLHHHQWWHFWGICSSEFLALIRKSVSNHRNYFTWSCCVYPCRVRFLGFKFCKRFVRNSRLLRRAWVLTGQLLLMGSVMRIVRYQKEKLPLGRS